MYFGSHALCREDFEQQRVTQSTINDVDLLDTTSERFQAGLDFRNHSLIDDTIVDQFSSLGGRQRMDNGIRIIFVTSNAVDVG